MDKDLQADIDKLSKFIRQAKYCVSTCEIIKDKHYEFTPSEFVKLYTLIEETDAALDRIVARIPEPKPAPDFDAIAREIESNAYQSGTFFPALCAQILRKHFGREDHEDLRRFETRSGVFTDVGKED